ncbi:MAG: hypothetical protein JW825_05805 [Candidatus Methanofastidiosa archaeon]|nr:hypothetical protein [Candidatus Methanofastidiosa archaeon]
MSDDDVKTIIERYSACKICTRENTKLCEESVDYLIRQVYFTTPFKRNEDEITKYCKHFNLSPQKLNKALLELSETAEKERILGEKVDSCAY